VNISRHDPGQNRAWVRGTTVVAAKQPVSLGWHRGPKPWQRADTAGLERGDLSVDRAKKPCRLLLAQGRSPPAIKVDPDPRCKPRQVVSDSPEKFSVRTHLVSPSICPFSASGQGTASGSGDRVNGQKPRWERQR
jgi:hypothetical protein